MYALPMCNSCKAEYSNIYNERHYSQTNSCPSCAVPMELHNAARESMGTDPEDIFSTCHAALSRGETIAVKGVGGYLLLCDASNAAAIKRLRQKKHRPYKPFAVMYANLEAAQEGLELQPWHIAALKSKAAPIVLCPFKKDSLVHTATVAPGLDKIGAMLPCSPLLQIIADDFDKPLVATSANISGSPIIYKDDDALYHLPSYAAYILSFQRDIVMPQDDSVMQFTPDGFPIILRRSRGMAPNYFPNPIPAAEPVIALGADLKSSFALAGKEKLYVSQFLGDQECLEAQQGYADTLNHLCHLVQHKPEKLLVDFHPAYFSTLFGQELAANLGIDCISIQHHKAHFAAVLAENNCLQSDEHILGFIWDGTGYGEDKMIWGGETFLYAGGEMNRVAHLKYFPQLLGDKMSREPRLSALALLYNTAEDHKILLPSFSSQEWMFYMQMMQQFSGTRTSSMGRLLDGIACILGLTKQTQYEGQAAMKLEALASSYRGNDDSVYALPYVGGTLNPRYLLRGILEDLNYGVDKAAIAFKVHLTLVMAIFKLAEMVQINHLAFSGGVFQNSLLVHLIRSKAPAGLKLFFHRQLSPNDECISFGQAAAYSALNEYNVQLSPRETMIYD